MCPELRVNKRLTQGRKDANGRGRKFALSDPLQNTAFEYRSADGIPERLRAAANELVQIPVDVIAVFGTPAAQAAKQATKTIPIVAISIGATRLAPD